MMPYPLRPLDLASGVMLGQEVGGDELRSSRTATTPLTALEGAVEGALRHPPCLVAFSGGRDSSTVLAAAVRVARREGLPDPIPATLRFPGVADAEESRWQGRVVDYLRLDDWTQIEVNAELDLIGPLATSALFKHGLLFPPNSHLVLALIENIEGGSLLTGLDGDGLMEGWRWQRGMAVLKGRASPSPGNIARLGLALAPQPVRQLVLRRRQQLQLSWLTSEAQRAVEEAAAAEAVDEPARWDEWVAWWYRQRYLRALMTSVDLLCSDRGVEAVHPLGSPAVLSAMSRAGGRLGFGTRAEATRVLIGDGLPAEVVERADKATFSSVYWNRYSRDFIERWSGEGVDSDLVDLEALHSIWQSQEPDFRTALLLQSAWLAASQDSADQLD